MSTSIDSIGQLINQFGVADSGDGLAVLRFLGLEINAAMVGVLGADADELRRSIDTLGERTQLQLYERLSLAGQLDLGDSVPGADALAIWTSEVWEGLRSDLSTLGYRLNSAQPANHLRYDITFPPPAAPYSEQAVFTETMLDSTVRSRVMGDWQPSVNGEGQRVWTVVTGNPPDTQTHTMTELQSIVIADPTEVSELMTQIDADTLTVVEDVMKQVNLVNFTLQEWMRDFLADERLFLQARKGDDNRTAAQTEAATRELRQILERLQAQGPQLEGLLNRLVSEARQPSPPVVARVSTNTAADAEPQDSPQGQALARLLASIEQAPKR